MYRPISNFPRDNGNVIILGAGASYDSSLKCKPPIIKDFVRKSKEFGIFNKYSLLWEFLDSIGYPIEDIFKGNPDIEKIYSVLDILSTGLWFRNANEYYNELGKFLKILPTDLLKSFIIEMINKPSIEALHNPCVYHNRIFEELNSGDIVISFNYDLIAESSLYKTGKWSEFNGYGFYCPEILFKEEKEFFSSLYDIEKYWSELKDNDIKGNSSKILLLKPHGSINWILRGGSRKKEWSDLPSFHEQLFDTNKIGGRERIEVKPLKKILHENKELIITQPIKDLELVQDFYEELKADPDNLDAFSEVKRFSYRGIFKGSYIIPPSTYKLTSLLPYEMIEIWSILKRALFKANRILFVGYSFREADLQFNTIFNLAMRNNESKDLKIGIIDPKKNEITKKLKCSFERIKIEPLCDYFREISDIDLSSFFNK